LSSGDSLDCIRCHSPTAMLVAWILWLRGIHLLVALAWGLRQPCYIYPKLHERAVESDFADGALPDKCAVCTNLSYKCSLNLNLIYRGQLDHSAIFYSPFHTIAHTNSLACLNWMPITVAARSQAWTVFARLNADRGFGSHSRHICLCVRLFCICVVLCVDHSSKESYRLCKKDYETEDEGRAQQRAVESLMND
jgi:hypothetical protein